MAKGKANVSSTGASMSKYDVEVESRLKALESKSHEDCGAPVGGGDCGDLEFRIKIIEEVLRRQPEVRFDFFAEQLRRELT